MDESEARPKSAFPHREGWNHSGMTLRDWFAGQAIATVATNVTGYPEVSAKYAYQVADAMMKEREK
jgi:hypothetical protein